MAKKGSGNRARVRAIKGGTSFKKQLQPQSVTDKHETELSGMDGIVKRPYPPKELQDLVQMSTILQQCVEAYRRNIVGFGAVPQYHEDDVIEAETAEMKAEWEQIQDFVKYFSFDMSMEDVFGEVIEDREITGNGYMEIMRDTLNMVVEGARINPEYMFITSRQDELVDVSYIRNGKTFKRKRRFRKYVQEIGAQKVYFKEYGDPRKMHKKTGEYSDSVPPGDEATEVLHFKIGAETYGVPRWIGQLVHMYGARKAEELNFKYFTQGRHTPMAILLHNATLSAESEKELTDYASSIEGVEHSHKFLIIEAEGLSEGILDEEKVNAKVEVKSLAEMLQNDALFLEYDTASREKVQSAFRLPDIYVGRSKDFNRATADTARYITEEQVFEPERKSLEWVINNKLLDSYLFKYTGVSFNAPEISDTEQLVALLDVANDIGAIAPNDIREVVGKFLGKKLENFEGEEYDVPASVASANRAAVQAEKQAETQTAQLQAQQSAQQKIQKATSDDLTDLLKDIRDLLDSDYEQRTGEFL